MNTTRRDDLLAVLHELGELSPEVRLGQLLANLDMLTQDRTGRSMWEVEDAELLGVMRAHRRDLSRRDQPVG